MERQEIVDRFKRHGIQLYPAGVWKFDAEGKKEAVVPYRADKLLLSAYPQDNMLKLRIEETPYMVIDIDGEDILDVLRLLPSIAKTFTTTTTREDKFHAYVMRPDNFPYTRVIGKLAPKVDVLSNGIVFEGHLYDISDKYSISESDTIVHLTEVEIQRILDGIDKKILKRNRKPVSACARYNIEEAGLVKTYLTSTLTNHEQLKLVKLLTPKGMRTESSKEWPKISYDTINTMAFYLALNSYIPHTDVLAFMEKILVKEYNLDLNSQDTKMRWYNSIVPTLPIIESPEFTTEFMEYVAQAPLNVTNTYRLLSTMDYGGTLKYIQINKNTLEPRVKNGVMLFNKSALQAEYPTLDTDAWTYGVPETQITDNPFAEHTEYRVFEETFVLNTLSRTEYQINVTPVDIKPRNVLTKSISGVFSPLDYDTIDAEDFYYHWLAHVLYSDTAVTTIMALVTPSNIAGGTGKTTLTATLPMHILPRGTVTAINDSMAKWSADVFLGRMAAFDDLFESEKWKEVYTIIKQQTSNTIKILDKKGKGTVLSDRRTNISISANFIPKIDESDRRFFLWAPREKLEPEDGNKIAKIFESYTEYSQEIQDIANYCKYLYDTEPMKYYNELYIKAPNTDISSISKSEGGLGETIISRILAGPERLFEDYIGGRDKWTDVQIAQFILLVATEPNNRCKHYTIALPWHFYNEVLKSLKADDNTDYTKGRLALVMGKVQFKDMGATKHSMYKEQYPDWTRYGLVHNMEDTVLNQYKKFLELKNKSSEFKQTLIIDGV